MSTQIIDRTPAEVFPPGEFIREEIEARGWSQAELAEILGRPPRLVSELIAGKRAITAETAKGLGEAFGTGAQFWMNLESAYQLFKAEPSGREGVVARRAKLYEKAPVKEMIRRRWIEPSESIEVLEKRVEDFLSVPLIPHAARKSTSYLDEVSPAQHAWLVRARQLAGSTGAASFSPSNIEGLLSELRRLLASAEEVRHVPRLLANAGIRFVIVEPLPQIRVDGACFWLDRSSPAIALSLRFDRIDWWWFTLMHELAHVKHKDGQDTVLLDVDLLGEDTQETKQPKPDFELKADEFAASFLVPPDKLQSFIARVKPLFSKQRIRAFAAQHQVHPGIVVGQLHHAGAISYAHSRDLLEKVRGTLKESALTDGWGSMLPVTM
jgi:HTH-type transcriptional regulator/antitoxin HigA